MNLTRFPRRRYTPGPTPLEPLERLSESMGGPNLFIKRDDLLGLAGGGNKTRKLEFLVADALARGADTLVTVGAVQSNHCRLTLAAAATEGLRCRLVLEERVPDSYDPEASGNNFLYRLLGAEEIRVVEGGTDLAEEMADVARELAAQGRRGYTIPGGGSSALGGLGYVACALELVSQALDEGLPIDHIVCASGSGGTHAGLVAGLSAMNVDIPVTGISVRAPSADQEAKVRSLAGEVLELLEVEAELDPERVTVLDDYVGPGYSIPTPATLNAVRTLAREEGILLDVVYTGKAMDGFLDLVRSGRFDADENVLFLHTGGAPSLFAFQRELLA